jgi:enoyl-CoA hydratase
VTESEAVNHTVVDRVFRVSLNRPPANALGLPLVTGLERALDSFEKSDARVLVITSALDGFFAAGADIKLMGSFSGAGGAADFAAYGEQLRGPLNRLCASERPSIAAIEGLALGGGLELALACTLRVGSRTARLGLPEAKLGLIPGAGGTQRLPRLIGRDVLAQEAYTIGLLDRLVEPGTASDEAMALATTLCGRSGDALTQIMRCVDDAADLPLEQGLAREAERVNELYTGPEATEGLQAFLAKRRPNYV